MQKRESSLRLMQDVFNISAKNWAAIRWAKLPAAILNGFRAVALTAGISLLFLTGADAGDWYVRPSSQGTATGTSWANAWSIANLNANWSSVQPGDTIWIAGGTYASTMSMQKSGTAAAWIYIKRPLVTDLVPTLAPGWSPTFDSQVIFNLGSSPSFSWQNQSSGQGSYVNIDGRVASGILCRQTSLSSSGPIGAIYMHGSANANGQRDITFANIELAGPGWNNCYPADQYAIVINAYSRTTVQNITFTNAKIHDFLGAGQIDNVNNFVLDHSEIYDTGNNSAGGSCAHNNVFYWDSSVGTFKNSIFHDTHGGEGIAFNFNNNNLTMYGCIWYRQSSLGVIWPNNASGGGLPVIRFYNNTFDGVNVTVNQGQSVQFASTSEAKNNIYLNSSWSQWAPSTRNNELSISSGTGVFVNAAARNYRLVGGAAAINAGAILNSPASQTYNIDPDGIIRGAGGAWDIGAYEYGTGGPTTNPAISLSVSTLDFGLVPSGASVTNQVIVRNTGGGILAGAATLPANSMFKIMGISTYSLSSNQSQSVSIVYTNAGSPGSYTDTVTFTGGSGASVMVRGASASVQPGNTFESYAGTITSPFVTNSGGYISQPNETTLAESGAAVYGFMIATAGSYTITANVNAPSEAANSFFVNIDNEPTDPAMIWDASVTSGFESRTVSWRGNGTFDNPQYAPVVFNLSAGTHQLIVRGREGGVQLGRISIIPVGSGPVAPPQNLRVASGF